MNISAWLIAVAIYAVWIAVASVIAIGLIAWDKRQARRDRWRTPEATLHLWELLGGWPGAFWARRHFRHKTIKRTYTWRARAMALLHILIITMTVIMLIWLQSIG